MKHGEVAGVERIQKLLIRFIGRRTQRIVIAFASPVLGHGVGIDPISVSPRSALTDWRACQARGVFIIRTCFQRNVKAAVNNCDD